MRLEINYKKKTVKNTNMWRPKHMDGQNNQWITEEIKEEINKYLEKNENQNTYGMQQKQFQEGSL